jgi:hypothetical protein
MPVHSVIFVAVHRYHLPQPFHLQTEELARSRGPRTMLSSDEQVAQMMQQLKPFKARPVDSRVLHSAGDVGVPKVARKKSTTFEPFVLETDKLHEKFLQEQRERLAAEEAERCAATQFHAAPVPTAIIAAPVAVKAKPAPRPVTEPANVVLSSDLRAQERERFEAVRRARMAEAEKAAQENAKRKEVGCREPHVALG